MKDIVEIVIKEENISRNCVFFYPRKSLSFLFLVWHVFISVQYLAAFVNIVWFAVTCAIITAVYISNSQKHRLANEKGLFLV